MLLLQDGNIDNIVDTFVSFMSSDIELPKDLQGNNKKLMDIRFEIV